MKTTRPLDDWREEQPYLQHILTDVQDMNAETQHRIPVIQKVKLQSPNIADDPTVLLVHLGKSGLRRNNVNVTRPLDVDERVTPGTLPVARPTVTTEPVQAIPEPVENISGELPTVNFYVPPFTWHMQILHAIKMRLETFKSISFNVRRIRSIHLCKRSYTVMKAMWTDYYYIDGCAIPVTDDHELSRKLRDNEVEIECW